MKYSFIDHPTEDAIIEHVLVAGKDEVQDHLRVCKNCSEAVTEFNDIKEALVNMPEEELPSSLRQNILKHADNGSKEFNLLSAIQLVRSPAVAGFGIVALVLFLYFLFCFIT
ncbi:MAG: hypothetical protein ACOCW2_01825 [Chitinivibrionales bacterium]